MVEAAHQVLNHDSLRSRRQGRRVLVTGDTGRYGHEGVLVTEDGKCRCGHAPEIRARVIVRPDAQLRPGLRIQHEIPQDSREPWLGRVTGEDPMPLIDRHISPCRPAQLTVEPSGDACLGTAGAERKDFGVHERHRRTGVRNKMPRLTEPGTQAQGNPPTLTVSQYANAIFGHPSMLLQNDQCGGSIACELIDCCGGPGTGRSADTAFVVCHDRHASADQVIPQCVEEAPVVSVSWTRPADEQHPGELRAAVRAANRPGQLRSGGVEHHVLPHGLTLAQHLSLARPSLNRARQGAWQWFAAAG